MLYLPSFRRSAHQADTPPPSFCFRRYTPEPIPSPAPLNHSNPNLSTNNTKTIPDNNGTTFIPPYSSPHLTAAALKPPQTRLTRLAQNAPYALLTLSLLTFAVTITVIGLATDTLRKYHDAQSRPHHLQLLPTNLDTSPTVAVLGSAALVAVLNATFIVVSVLQVTRTHPNPSTTTYTPLLTLLTSLTTLPFAIFALTYYHLHAFSTPPSFSPTSSSSSYGPALAAGPVTIIARGVAPAPIPTPTPTVSASAHSPSSTLSSPGATSAASVAVAGLQGWACRSGVGSVAGRICEEGRVVGGLLGVVVGLCVFGVVGGGVGVWLGRNGRKAGRKGEREREREREEMGKGREDGGWL